MTSPSLTVVADAGQRSEALSELRARLRDGARAIEHPAGNPGGVVHLELYWHDPPGLWTALAEHDVRDHARYYLGLDDPSATTGPVRVVCELRFPHEDAPRRSATQFALDDDGGYHLVHIRHIGSRSLAALNEHYQRSDRWVELTWPDGSKTSGIDISPLDSPHLLRDLREFVTRADRSKRRSEEPPVATRNEPDASRSTTSGAPDPRPAEAPPPATEAHPPTPKPPALDRQLLTALFGRNDERVVPAQKPDPELVTETLDAEMARIEQSLVRTGWTSWVGTAALAAVVWIFVSLFDTGDPFPWSRFAVLVAFLSFIQEFVYSLNNALRPRRGLGLLVGDQMRMVISAETLPFARPHYLFEGARAALLIAASWFLLPEFIGWAWLLPFVWYSGVLVTMGVFFALSLRKKLVPKWIRFFPGELVRHAILLGLACYGLDALTASHEPTDFLALKGALLMIAALHLLRGLTAPRFELPALERLREIRRQLGFGQMAPQEAVHHADVALFGYNSLLVLARPLRELAVPMIQFHERVGRVAEDLDVLTRQISALSAQEGLTQDDLSMREVLARDIMSRIREAIDSAVQAEQAHDQLSKRIERYQKRTVNDHTVPLVIELVNRQSVLRKALMERLVVAVRALAERLNTLEPLAARHRLALAPDVRDSARTFLMRLSPPAIAANKPASS